MELSESVAERIIHGKYLNQYEELEPGQGFPSILDNISDLGIPEKERVLSYLEEAERLELAVAGGIKGDCFTGAIINPPVFCTDGEWYWTSEVTHYFKNYNLKLPQEFIDKAIKSAEME